VPQASSSPRVASPSIHPHNGHTIYSGGNLRQVVHVNLNLAPPPEICPTECEGDALNLFHQDLQRFRLSILVTARLPLNRTPASPPRGGCWKRYGKWAKMPETYSGKSMKKVWMVKLGSTLVQSILKLAKPLSNHNLSTEDSNRVEAYNARRDFPHRIWRKRPKLVPPRVNVIPVNLRQKCTFHRRQRVVRTILREVC
jgi:hypothetical protein